MLLISGSIYDTVLSGRDPEGNYIYSWISTILKKKIDRHRKRKEEMG